MFRGIRALMNFATAEGLLEESPVRNVRSPRVPNDQIVPLDPSQLQRMIDAARRTRAAERDAAIVKVLADTGLRAGELCSLTLGDLDRGTGELLVMGKGGKRRKAYLGVTARRALWRYIELDRRDAPADEPLFAPVGGHQAGTALTPNGLGQIIRGLGRAAGITGARVSPHSLRHSFAISYLRNGGNVLELQRLLGHES